MTIRRLLLAAAVAFGVLLGSPTSAAADTACAWVDPYGVCVGNPLPGIAGMLP